MSYKEQYNAACRYALALTLEYNKLLEENRQLRFPLTGDAAGGIIEERYNPNQPRDEKGRWSSSGGGMININIGSSVGASAKNYPVKLPDSNQKVKLIEGQKIEGKVFAGKGTGSEIRERFRLESTYNIPADKWQKVSGNGIIVHKGKQRNAELNWYQADDIIVEMKVKRYIDES